MFLLEKVHPSVQAAIDRIFSGANRTPNTVVRELDGCEYHIRVDWKENKLKKETEVESLKGNGHNSNGNVTEERASVTIAIKHTTPFKELNAYRNFDEILPTLFPQVIQKFVQPDAFDRSEGEFIAEVYIPSSVSEKIRNDAIKAASQLRIWSYIPVFVRQCETYLTKPDLVKPILFHYHTGEEMIIFNHKGSFVVTIALRTASRDEAVFTRHFLQSMMDAKKLQREISAAPAFVFDHGKVPDTIPNNIPISCGNDPNVFWCSFQLFRRQMEPIEHLIETVTQLVNFRSTLAYHIHAGRTYMHGMMRKRVETSLQVLNRAKTKTTGKAKIALQ